MTQRWNPSEPLERPRTWLLEASAGTGKTFQIAGLYVRLVAELGFTVDRILAITFTNPATAELKERVRARLRLVRDALQLSSSEGASDPTVRHLRSLPEEARARAVQRLDAAILDFDRAVISTIHSFARRSLEEFAFESGQDPNLELLQSTTKLQEELVDDALARVHAGTNLHELTRYEEAGFKREILLDTARELSGATRAQVVPNIDTNDPLALRSLFLKRRALFAAHLRLLRGPKARSCFDAMLEDAASLYAVANPEDLLKAWTRYVEGMGELKLPKALPSTAWLRSKWRKPPKGKPVIAIEDRPWWKLAVHVDSFLEKDRALWSEFLPVASFARGFRDALEARLDARSWLTFDGMLSRLAEGVERAGGAGEHLATQLADRYDAVFVDEFQDTDLAQWTVLRRAFHGRRHLFLIGDPKQAIYAFRGADVNVYLAAKSAISTPTDANSTPGVVRTMAENWRSDPAAVTSMNRLWQAGSGAFESASADEMDYVEVATPEQQRLTPNGPGFDLRYLDGRLGHGKDEGPGTSLAHAPRRLAARLAAEEVHAWLSEKRGQVRRTVTDDDGETRDELTYPRPSDLAILVPGHGEARAVRDALARLGIPAITASKKSVFASPAARWLEAWLRAVEAAGRDREARTAVVTPLFGWSANELAWALAIAERGDEARREARTAGYDVEAESAPRKSASRDWNTWTERLRRAAERWTRLGFARTLDRELDELESFSRLLAMPSGERHVTDFRHLFELLHAEERRRKLGPRALADWIRREAEEDASEREQRLESDADAVRIETVHVSKGLEYPLVLLPFLSSVKLSQPDNYGPISLRDGRGKVVDLHPPEAPQRNTAQSTAECEARREQLRLLYVATTRAKHRTIAWWGPAGQKGTDTEATPLGRLALRAENGTFGTTDYPTFADVPPLEPTPSSRFPSGDTPSTPSTSRDDGADANERLPETGAPSAHPYHVVAERLDALVARSDGTIAWSVVERASDHPRPWLPPDPLRVSPAWPAARKLPSFSGRWGVTSYSGLAKGAAAVDRDERIRKDEQARAAAETDAPTLSPATSGREPRQASAAARTHSQPLDDGEGAAADVAKPDLLELDAPARLSAGRGTVFGTFVHELFEHVDFTRFPLDATPTSDESARAELRDLAEAVGARHGFGAESREVTDVLARFPSLLTTPLGSKNASSRVRHLAPDFTLSRLSREDRLDEFEFDLKLGDGTRYRRASVRAQHEPTQKLEARDGCVDPEKVYAALEHEKGVPGLEGWLAFQRMRRSEGRALVGSIAGILTGSIDLVFRTKKDDGQFVYFLADYKTNLIGASAAGHYTGPWLDWKMATSGYVLQSLLYTLALHRHLASRIHGYDYDKHVGGALYLFVRGMAGPSTPPCGETGHRLGVHAHRWSKETIIALDEALAPSGSVLDGPPARTKETNR